MVNPLKAFDTAILSVYQRITDYVELHTGLNCFKIMSLFVILSSVFMYGAFWKILHDDPRLVFIVVIAALGNVYVSFQLLRTHDRLEMLHEKMPGARNSNEDRWGFRLFMCLLGIQFVCITKDTLVLSILTVGSLISLLYFSACSPLPPGTRKRTKKKESSPSSQLA